MVIPEKYLPTIPQKHSPPILAFYTPTSSQRENKAYFILWIQLVMKKLNATVHERLQQMSSDYD